MPKLPSETIPEVIEYIQFLERVQLQKTHCCAICDSLFDQAHKTCPACKKAKIKSIDSQIFITLNKLKTGLFSEYTKKGWSNERIAFLWDEIIKAIKSTQ